jgi:hypothetical protein
VSSRLLLSFVCVTVLPLAAPAFGQGDRDFASFTDARIAAWQPSPAERRFDEIGWSTDIRAALALAKENHRPVFLFTHDGRMGVGRQ